jgi:hypothetical protein
MDSGHRGDPSKEDVAGYEVKIRRRGYEGRSYEVRT